ncbi:MAG: helix-turn-helix transcriptional regulator [Clostridia bacterium]|nr:helix-turn-helix transcriptional regulator [Clostridia bacterium]
MDIFAIRLKEIRIEKGFTQKQLAAAIKTTDDSIYSWEKGRSQPSIEMLRNLCKELDISADYLLGLKDDSY